MYDAGVLCATDRRRGLSIVGQICWFVALWAFSSCVYVIFFPVNLVDVGRVGVAGAPHSKHARGAIGSRGGAEGQKRYKKHFIGC